MKRRIKQLLQVMAGVTMMGVVVPEPANAQWSRMYEQFYLPASHNWAFRQNYPAADRMFNAFDYGHAILYEELYKHPGAPVSRLEEKEYDFITRKLLVDPPHVPLEEAAIEVQYAKLAPEAKAMFDWAHLLHRQIYDVWADESIPVAEKDALVAGLVRYYKTRPDLAFSSVPKTMELMEGQFYSTVFRKKYPKFNGLIWAYHWLQVGLYEPLLVGRDVDERQTGVTATVARFWQMIQNPPQDMPRLMPMTAAVSPVFAARYPEAAIIFDNLHSMHDVVSDILASSAVPKASKRKEIMLAAERYRDRTSFVTTEAGWREMTAMMGLNNMGGPAVNFLPAFPKPTVERGAVMSGMAGMQHGAMNMADTSRTMTGMQHGNMNMPKAEPMPGMKHDSTQHGNMDMAGSMSMAGMSNDSAMMRQMMQMHERMMQDPVIRERMMTDPELMRMMNEMMPNMQMEAGTGSPARMDLLMQLLNDPTIESRIHSDPALHALYSDPEVQRCLAELKKLRATGKPMPAACPLPNSQHKH